MLVIKTKAGLMAINCLLYERDGIPTWCENALSLWEWHWTISKSNEMSTFLAPPAAQSNTARYSKCSITNYSYYISVTTAGIAIWRILITNFDRLPVVPTVHWNMLGWIPISQSIAAIYNLDASFSPKKLFPIWFDLIDRLSIPARWLASG